MAAAVDAPSKDGVVTQKLHEMFANSKLTERLDRLERENKFLRAENQELKVKLEQQRADQADIYHSLDKRLDDNYHQIQRLQKALKESETERERLAADCEKKTDEQKMVADGIIENLKARNKILEEKLEGLESFQQNKWELEERLRKFALELEEEKRRHVDDISELERKHVQEKEKLKKDMLLKIKETKQNLLAMTEDQLHTTTKRTIMENEQMTTELQYQSKETEKLLLKNQRLSVENKELKRDIEIHRQLEQELAKRTHFYQRLIKKLHQKLKGTESFQSVSESVSRDRDRSTDRGSNDEIIRLLESKINQLEHSYMEAQESLEEVQLSFDTYKAEHSVTCKQQSSTDDDNFTYLPPIHTKYSTSQSVDEYDGLYLPKRPDSGGVEGKQSIGIQTSGYNHGFSSERSYMTESINGDHAAALAAANAVDIDYDLIRGPVRPWGRRAQMLPLTTSAHGSHTYLKKQHANNK
eukprot:GILK01001954.1.p1 GENE.GILK01001954.1~~GILK01001954.1.p1  ORF type:complete len:486 (-),score=142.02 GILK01001954.1:67-1479(-)